MAHMDCMSVQILNGGAPCQQIDSEEDDDQEAEAEDEVRRCIANFKRVLKLLAPVTLSRAMLQALLPPCATPAISMLLPPCCNPCCHPGVVGL